MNTSPLECADELEARLTKKGYKLSSFDKWAIRYLAEFRHEFRDHCNEEVVYIKSTDGKLSKIETALFDPLDGIVNVREWIRRIFLGTVALMTTLAAVIVWVLTIRGMI